MMKGSLLEKSSCPEESLSSFHVQCNHILLFHTGGWGGLGNGQNTLGGVSLRVPILTISQLLAPQPLVPGWCRTRPWFCLFIYLTDTLLV